MKTLIVGTGITGVIYGWAGMANPPEVPQELKNDSFIIYLVHEPPYRGDWDANLTLAGHTHGGQVIPAGSERVLSAGRVTLSGKIGEENKITYIPRGTGPSDPDITLRASPPEIVSINPPLPESQPCTIRGDGNGHPAWV